jgi:prephenate dehydratase
MSAKIKTGKPETGKPKPGKSKTGKSIAYQGEPGANSHIACLDNYPRLEPLACATFEDAFAALQDGAAELAMIPIENSIAGRVADIHALLPASGLHIVAETFLPIHFQLLAIPGAAVSELRAVYSHVHALGQCRKIIRKYKLKPIVAGDTAGSAREVAEAGDPTRASLATKLAGEIYGLTTLAANVEDEAHNTTRFVVLSKTPNWVGPRNGAVVTTFVFRVRNVPAALYKSLGGFATNGVNMTKLESYMVEGEFSATQFLADVDGHPEDPALSRALEELTFFSREVRILGVYPAHKFRIESQKQAE